MAHLLANGDEKRQQAAIVVFIAVNCCELLLVISLNRLVMRISLAGSTTRL
jgi:hypothetical protein